jgi:hypothetical protein
MSTTMFDVPGRFFGGAVDLAQAAAQPAEKRSLPNAAFQLLTSLPGPKDEAEASELNALLAEHHTLNVRTQAYVDKKLSELRTGLQEDHEKAKAAVRAQLEVIEGLRQQHADVSREWYAAKEIVVAARLKLDTAQQEAQSLSRFASSAAIASAQKKWVAAQEELDRVGEPEGIALREMNHINLTLLPEQLKKRDELIEQETRLAALLVGKDPDLATLGFVSRA